MLTVKQRDLLQFVHHRLRHDGVAPSYDEMKDALKLKSKSGVHRLIGALVERGFLRRMRHRARALEVLKLPQGGQFAPLESQARPTAASVSIPLYGRVAAGRLTEAVGDQSESIALPPFLLGGGGEHYALVVSGDSMINAGIHDGDIAVMRRCEDAENGAIVSALADGESATLKRLRRKGQSIALEAANPAYETQLFGADRIKIQGRMVALIRRYHPAG